MFGYISVNKPELKVREFERYHAYYCGLCRDLKRSFGVTGQITLSYDLTFVGVLLSALYEPEEQISHLRCVAHPVSKHATIQNAYTAYAADMNVLMAYYKAADDKYDEHSLKGRAGAFVLRRKVRKIVKKYPKKCKLIHQKLREIRKLEKENCDNPDLCAGAFGEIMGAVCCFKEDEWEKTLYRLGFFLGKFIYLMDAYEDLESDLQKNNYNPLKHIRNNDKEHYETRVKQMLEMMMTECARAFERLPLIRDAELLRNILYAGVWVRYTQKHDTIKNDV